MNNQQHIFCVHIAATQPQYQNKSLTWAGLGALLPSGRSMGQRKPCKISNSVIDRVTGRSRIQSNDLSSAVMPYVGGIHPYLIQHHDVGTKLVDEIRVKRQGRNKQIGSAMQYYCPHSTRIAVDDAVHTVSPKAPRKRGGLRRFP